MVTVIHSTLKVKNIDLFKVVLLCDSRITYRVALLTGDSAAKTLRMLNIMNVASISESTYYRHTSSYVNPVIIQQWKEHQQQLLHSLSGNENGLVLADDGRCDSPGYSALIKVMLTFTPWMAGIFVKQSLTLNVGI